MLTLTAFASVAGRTSAPARRHVSVAAGAALAPLRALALRPRRFSASVAAGKEASGAGAGHAASGRRTGGGRRVPRPRGGGHVSVTSGANVEFDQSAVFKVLATHCEPYYTMPWSTSPQTNSAASAFALALGAERFLVTNAHAVHHASVVELQRPGEGTKHLARVACYGPDCDLALLEVEADESEAFWRGVEPFVLREDPPLLNDSVRVIGYPVGGENACITQGVVSRIDLQPYQHGLSSLLAIQIDAAINPGNSGGPALDSRRRCIGVAFQSLKDGETENIGYVIPSEVIASFLRGFAKSGRYAGFGYCGFAWQPLDNRGLQQAIGAEEGGVLIKRVEPLTPSTNLLRRRDVLVSIAGLRIECGGTGRLRGRERIAFPYAARRLNPGDVLPLEILREGQRHELTMTLGWHTPLVQMHPPQPPAYVVFGGLVFVPLSEPYLRSEWGELFEERAPICLVLPWIQNVRSAPGEEVVVLSCVLGSPFTAGLTHFVNRRLLRCAGRRVLNLAHLARIIDEDRSEFLSFELDDDELIALPRSRAEAMTAEILRTHLIPAPRSLPQASGSGHEDDLNFDLKAWERSGPETSDPNWGAGAIA
eukprot:TRINITY_DN17991_c0_g1_i1.p1 TRINITY_DN17991_c0_g1~~TRINITY_DN17991_c0_g1_i1.p1  ORF type:complete len:595 (+),score=110.65 TRINITY_DN17991_c0_g1_i1:55-1839(+)